MACDSVYAALFSGVLLLLASSFSPGLIHSFHEMPSSMTSDSSEIYGFIIPLPSGNDTTFETLLNSRSTVLVNDLLREDITVFWATEPVSCFVSPITDMRRALDISFNPGAFIIPFGGDVFKDVLMTSIIFDYCIEAELDDWCIPLEGYLLLQPLCVSSIELVEPRIAQHFGTSIRYGWPVYLQIADAGGFLNFDFFLDGEIETLLRSDSYNVFMWPYEPTPARTTEALKDLLDKQSFNVIRRFVAQGGGYIGSCYGAQVASCGFLQPLSFFSLTYAYHPEKPYFPYSFTTSMSDTIQNIHWSLLEDLFISTSVITNASHPLAFGVNRTVKDFFSGPWFVYLGRNSECVSVFDTIALESSSPPPVVQKIIGTPNWVASTFGYGKLALFASHPEFVNNISLLFDQRIWPEDHYYGRRVIQNALLYVTGKSDRLSTQGQRYSLGFVEEIRIKTHNLTLPASETQFFDASISQLAKYSSDLFEMQNLSSALMRAYSDVFSDDVLFQKDSKPLLYSHHFGIILRDYAQKAIQTLRFLEEMTALESIDQDELMDDYIDLAGFIDVHIDDSNKLLLTTHHLLNRIKDHLNGSSIPMVEKIQLIEESREMITTLESSLKYVPQMYFESLKTLRHYWYQYESMVAC